MKPIQLLLVSPFLILTSNLDLPGQSIALPLPAGSDSWIAFDTSVEIDPASGLPTGQIAPWGPGIFDSDSGNIHLGTTSTLPPAPQPPDATQFEGLLGMLWQPSMGEGHFSNGRIRAKVRAGTGSNADLLLRTDPLTGSTYVMTALGSFNEFHFSRIDKGVVAWDEVVPGITFTEGEDWFMEFGAIDHRLEMKAWKVGDSEPSWPQLTVFDHALPQGAIGLSASVSTTNITEATAVDSVFSELTFIPAVTAISPRRFAESDPAGANSASQAVRYQQVFPASDFETLKGLHLITEFRWRPDVHQGRELTSTIDDVTLSLSVTNKSPGTLSRTFESNVQNEPIEVYRGPITIRSRNLNAMNGLKEFDMLVPFQTPFEYDPSTGNLLLEIHLPHGTPGPLFQDGFSTPELSASMIGGPNSESGNPTFGGLVTQFTMSPLRQSIGAALQAGDADQDFDFDQLDLVQVQVAAKYLSEQAATWGEGDWNGAPGGSPGNPPAGDGLFNQFDVIAAQQAGTYLTGPYAALQSGGQSGDGQTSVVYTATTGELSVDAPAGTELTSINIDSAAGIFTGQPAGNLGGSFDNDADSNIFKATFGGSFGSLSFGNVAQVGLAEEFLLNDLTVVGSLSGGGDLGNVDLVYVPEPASAALLAVGLLIALMLCGRIPKQCGKHPACAV